MSGYSVLSFCPTEIRQLKYNLAVWTCRCVYICDLCCHSRTAAQNCRLWSLSGVGLKVHNSHVPPAWLDAMGLVVTLPVPNVQDIHRHLK